MRGTLHCANTGHPARSTHRLHLGKIELVRPVYFRKFFVKKLFSTASSLAPHCWQVRQGVWPGGDGMGDWFAGVTSEQTRRARLEADHHP